MIEMLVVIVIIGILASLIIVNVAGGRRKALATKAKADVEQVYKVLNSMASEGCLTVSVAATSGNITCANPTSTKIHAVIPEPPNGMTYTVSIGAATNLATNFSTTAATTGFTGASLSGAGGIRVQASGGFNPSAENFTCSDGGTTAPRPGCYCSVEGGCNDTL